MSILRINGLLGPQDLAFVDQVLERADWRDGAETVGDAARHLKRNQELDRRVPGAADIERLVHGRLSADRAVSDFALPARFSRPIVSRYDVGQEYGLHVDNPLLGGAGGQMRTDISCTVFLSAPETYDGGELTLFHGEDETKIKMNRGDAVLYTTGTPHRVAPVTRGARVAAICWLQSIVQDPHRRAILSDFHRAHHGLIEQGIRGPAMDLFLQGYYNLVRLWSQPA